MTGTGKQGSSSAYPYRRAKLTHEVKIVTRGLPSGTGGEKEKGSLSEKTRAFKSEVASSKEPDLAAEFSGVLQCAGQASG